MYYFVKKNLKFFRSFFTCGYPVGKYGYPVDNSRGYFSVNNSVDSVPGELTKGHLENDCREGKKPVRKEKGV
jgi:hypothetical protein